MGKRFTESEKWGDRWFRRLSPTHKLAWLYLVDNCDLAGVAEIDCELASFQIGCDVDWDEFFTVCGSRIEEISEGAFWIVRFVHFQYGEQLSLASRMHKAVIACLQKHGLDTHPSIVIIEESDTIAALRKRITRKYRESIYATDQYRCQLCGIQFPQHELTLDHLKAVSRGGDNCEANLYTCCRSCNSQKFDEDIFVFLNRTQKALPDGRLRNFLNTPSKQLESLTATPDTRRLPSWWRGSKTCRR